jgi:hypothetical protein
MYKDYGSFEIQELGPGELSVELCALPPELAAHQQWHRSVASGLYALYFLTGAKGTTELRPGDASQRRIRIALRWSQ